MASHTNETTAKAFSGSVLNLPSLSLREEPEEPAARPTPKKRVDPAEFKEARRFHLAAALITKHVERASPSAQGRETQQDQLRQLAEEIGTLPNTASEVAVNISPALGQATVPDLDAFCMRDTGLPPVMDVFQETFPHNPDAKRHGPREVASEEFGRSGVAANHIPPWAARAVVYSTWYNVETYINNSQRVEDAMEQLCRASRGGTIESGIHPYVRRVGSIDEIRSPGHVIVPADELVQLGFDGCIAPVVFTTATSQRPCAMHTLQRGCYSPDVRGLQLAWEISQFLMSHQSSRASTSTRQHLSLLCTSEEEFPDPFTTLLACRAPLSWTSTAVNCTHDGVGPFDTVQAYTPPCSITGAAAYVVRVGAVAPKVYGGTISDMFGTNIGLMSSTPHPSKSLIQVRAHAASTGFFSLSNESTLFATALALGTGITASMLIHTPPIMGTMNGKPAALLSRPWMCSAKFMSAVYVAGCYLPPITPSAEGITRPIKLASTYPETLELEPERSSLQTDAFDLVAPIVRELYDKAIREVDAGDGELGEDERIALIQERANSLITKSMPRMARMGPVVEAVVMLTGFQDRANGKVGMDPNTVFVTDAYVFVQRAMKACQTGHEDAYLFLKTEQVLRTAFFAQVLSVSPKYLHDWAVLYLLNYERPKAFHPGKTRSTPNDVSLDLVDTVNLIRLAFGNSGKPERPFGKFVERCMHSLAQVIMSKMTGTFVVPSIIDINNV